MAEKNPAPAPEPMDDGFVMIEDSSVPAGGRRRDPAGSRVDLGGGVDLNKNGSQQFLDLVQKLGLNKHEVFAKYSVNLAERVVVVHLRTEDTPGSTPVTVDDRNCVSFNILSVFEQYPKIRPSGTVKAKISTRTVKGEKVFCITLRGATEHHSQPRKNNNSTKQTKTEKNPKPQEPKASQDGGSAAS